MRYSAVCVCVCVCVGHAGFPCGGRSIFAILRAEMSRARSPEGARARAHACRRSARRAGLLLAHGGRCRRRRRTPRRTRRRRARARAARRTARSTARTRRARAARRGTAGSLRAPRGTRRPRARATRRRPARAQQLARRARARVARGEAHVDRRAVDERGERERRVDVEAEQHEVAVVRRAARRRARTSTIASGAPAEAASGVFGRPFRARALCDCDPGRSGRRRRPGTTLERRVGADLGAQVE